MKKFLSVLLALAVAFTFTFGSTMSAFADDIAKPETTYTVSQVSDAIDAEAEAAKALIDNYAAIYASKVADGTIKYNDNEAYKFDAAVIKTVLAAKIATAKAAVDTAVVVQKTNANTAAAATDFIAFYNSDNESGTVTNANYVDCKSYLAAVAAVVGSFDADEEWAALIIGSNDNEVVDYEDLLKAQFEATQAKALADVDKIDVSKYSNEIPEAAYDTNDPKYYVQICDMTTSKFMSMREQAQAYKDYAVKKINSEKFDAVNLDANKTVIWTTIPGYVTAAKTSVSGLTTEAQDKLNAADIANAKATVVAYVESTAATKKADVLASINSALRYYQRLDRSLTTAEKEKVAELEKAAAALDAEYKAVVDLEKYRIENELKVGSFTYAVNANGIATVNAANGTVTITDGYKTLLNTLLTAKYSVSDNALVTATNTNIDLAKAMADKVAELTASAELTKKTIGYDNNYAYAIEAIDKALEDAIAEVYACTTTAAVDNVPLNAPTAAALLKARINELLGVTSQGVAVQTKVKIDNVGYNPVSQWATTGYDEEKAEEVEDVIDAAKKAIKNAATLADADKEFLAAYAKYTAIPTTDDRDKLYQKGGALKDAYDNYAKELAAQMAYKEALLSATEKALYENAVFGKTGTAYDVVTLMNAELQKAYTAEELDAKYAEMKALIDGLMTKKEVADAKKAFDAKVIAYMGTVTEADKADLLSLKKDIEEFNTKMTLTKAGAAYSNQTLNAYIVGIRNAEVKALNDKYDAIKKVTSLDQKAAVEELRAAYDAYVESYKDVTDVDATTDLKATDGAIKAYEAAIKTLEVNAVIEAIAKLPVDGSDPAAVKAAREAYDALDYAQKADVTNLTKLQAAESAVEAAGPKYTDVNAKADLLDMSRKLTIWRTSKTSIKVTAVGSVKNIKANGYTVKYSFYKKAPGATSYKLVKTTTSNKYTYTNLKKGTNKFQVKVKVYDADGKLVATKMTYYRAAKIK